MAIVLFAALSAYAQGVSVSGQAIVNTPTSVSGIPGNSVLQAVPNAQITVCSFSGGGIPCSPLVTIYSNPTLTVVASNPVTADVNGNFQFWVPAGNYLYSQTGPGIVGQLFVISVGIGNVTGTGTANALTGWTSTSTIGNVTNWTWGAGGLSSILCSNSATCDVFLFSGNLTGLETLLQPASVAVSAPGFSSASVNFQAPNTGNASVTITGATSGSASISVASVAGTPCTLLYATASPTAGQFLQSAAPVGGAPGTCQQAWATAFTSCGTIAANGSCSNTGTSLGHCIAGIATLSAGTSTITGISPAFTNSSSFFVTTNDLTTITNASKGVPASGTSITFTGTGTDNISFVACGA